MALRQGKRLYFNDWFGLQTFASTQNLEPGWFYDSSNVIVTNDGSASCLRSPALFNDPATDVLIGSPPALIETIFDFDRQGGRLTLFDTNASTFVTTGTTNTLLFGGAPGKAKYITVNNRAYRLQGNNNTFVSLDGTPTSIWHVGIQPPTIAPSISYTSGGSGSIVSSVNISYAYRNSVTTHISAPSPVSNTLGPGGTRIHIPHQTSNTFGVDQIVIFMTLDGGAIRYLLIDSLGNPLTFPNSGAFIDLVITGLIRDRLTPETSFNIVPPLGAFYMFKFGNRLCLCDFRDADRRPLVQYCGFESVYAGIPWESWPPLNAIYLPNKGDNARGGIETPIGALVFGELDSYLIRGRLSDKVSGPSGGISITESIQSMGWALGTRSPFTAQTTPFGVLWLDQNKRIQLWPYDGFPQEAGLPIRNILDDIADDDQTRYLAEATWFQHGKDGGAYVLTASTDGVANNRLYIISIYRDPQNNQLKFACAVSDIAAQSVGVLDVNGVKNCYIGGLDRIFQILDLDLRGAGWATNQKIYFKTIAGNEAEFAYWHSLRFDATSIVGLTVRIANLDGSEDQQVELIQETGNGGAYYGLLDSYGFRKTFTFNYSKNDSQKRQIQNLRIAIAPKARLL